MIDELKVIDAIKVINPNASVTVYGDSDSVLTCTILWLEGTEEISREDKSVADYIRTVETFKNISGDFDVEKYKRYVAATGVNIKEFESALKDDLVRELVLNVFQAPST